MPRRDDIQKILVLGSGPIVIGQAAEFDYSGAQACKVLLEEGYEVVLVNSNPATIMTDPEFATATYVEPLLPGPVTQVIEREQPDALLPTLGGQTALNLAKTLYEDGTLERHGVELIGADYDAINRAEDRDQFDRPMQAAGLRTAKNVIATGVEDALAHLEDVGLPAIIRPAFTLGGRGGGIARTREQYAETVARGIAASPIGQVLIDESVLGWGEFELEVMRDHRDNVVIVCSIENIDPMGVHTGDSVTVAPQQTLTDRLYQKLRDQAIAVIRAVGVETGGSNVQFAVNPVTEEIIVIEMNPRVSRSSALASKATGFPIAKIAARLAVGYRLDEIPNDITRRTPASFEPALDYVVVKWPRFAFEKFPGVDAALSTHMKSDGEALARARRARPGRHADRGAAGRDRDARCRPLRRDPRAARPRRVRRRGPGPHRHRPLVPARAPTARHGRPGLRAADPPHLPRRRHLRRRVRGRDAVLLLGLGARRARQRGRPRRQAERDDPRLRPEPHRPGDRVRLLLRARRDDRARVRPRRRDGQLQPGDGLDGLRHLRPPVLRAADARGRARHRRGRAARGRDRPVRRPDAAQARRRARARGRAAARHPARGDRPGRGPRTLRRAAGGARLPRAALRHRVLARRGAGERGAGGLPAAGAPELRARRAGDGDRVLERGPRGLPAPHAGRRPAQLRGRGGRQARRARDLPRPLPRERDRGRRRRDLRRRGRLDRRDHAARRGGRDPLGGLGLRAPAALARRRDAARDPRGDVCARAGARRRRADQRAVRRPRRGALRDRGQPARLAYGPVRVQGDRAAAGQAGLPRDARRAARRPRPARRSVRGARVGQGGGTAVRPLRGGRRLARARDALDRRGHGRRAGLPRRVRQGAGGGRRAAAGGGDRLPHRDRLRQGGRGRDRRPAPRPRLHRRGHARDGRHDRPHGHPGRDAEQAGGGLAARRRQDRRRRHRARHQHADGDRGAGGRLRHPPRGDRPRDPVHHDHVRRHGRGARDRRRAPGLPDRALAAGDPPRQRGGRRGRAVSRAPFGRRRLRVTGQRAVGAYDVLSVADPDGPAPGPGQFAMLAAVDGWGGLED